MRSRGSGTGRYRSYRLRFDDWFKFWFKLQFRIWIDLRHRDRIYVRLRF
ncbi:hypothetical protein GCM10011585_29030 [Edaphobacter dinghuensis]|uniref:Uncharacterized protein n=1 Tax=Edaphobacter dinghuensis TaxID=1560005 RepID=A0A917HM33_9BACT|nr:hypothetical protein GCM10011585_29030 [Edaphobacter dinghuensis]